MATMAVRLSVSQYPELRRRHRLMLRPPWASTSAGLELRAAALVVGPRVERLIRDEQAVA